MIRTPVTRTVVAALVLALAVAAPASLRAQESAGPQETDGEPGIQTEGWDPDAEELDEALRRWVDEYVRWIITDEEKQIFEALPTPEQKIAFIDRFWQLRDPTPGTPENEYRQEHLERFVTATRRFSAGKPGWATDRGRIYIILGPPNNLQRNPTGRGAMERASEVWTYNLPDHPYLPGVLDLNFVDFRGTGEFELVSDLDAAAPIETAQFGYANNPLDVYALRRHATELYDERFLTHRRNDPVLGAQDFLQFQQQVRNILEVPEIHVERLRALRESVEADVRFDAFPVRRAVALYGATEGATAAQVTVALDYDQLTSTTRNARHHFSADLYAALERDGETVDDDERRLSFSLTGQELQQLDGKQILQPLQLMAPPGTYELVVLVRDNASEDLGRDVATLELPDLYRPGLTLSSLTLASHIETASSDPESGPEPFQQGDLRVVPNVTGEFHTDQRLYLYLQAYGLTLGGDDLTNRVRLEGQVLRDGDPFKQIPGQHPYPAPLERQSFSLALPLSGYPGGDYTVEIRVVDERSGETATARADFRVVDDGAGGS
ncbi:MAG: GWxTD domain-containing protein [Acidobacteriota bacterium]